MSSFHKECSKQRLLTEFPVELFDDMLTRAMNSPIRWQAPDMNLVIGSWLCISQHYLPSDARTCLRVASSRLGSVDIGPCMDWAG